MKEDLPNAGPQWTEPGLVALMYEICFSAHRELGSKQTLVHSTVIATLAGLLSKISGHRFGGSQLSMFVQILERLFFETADEEMALISMAALKRVHTLVHLEGAHPAMNLTQAYLDYLSQQSRKQLAPLIASLIETAQEEIKFWNRIGQSMKQA